MKIPRRARVKVDKMYNVGWRNDMKRKSGFTLIELLVTIGIIVILIAILLPVVAAVRKAGYATATKQEIATIAGACQAYYGDFRSYPGPISENDIDAALPPTSAAPTMIGGFALKDTSGNPLKVTSSENLVLGLSGGLYLTFPAGVATGWVYDPASVGKGPQVLNTLLNSQKQAFAYFTPRPEEISPTTSTGAYVPFVVGNSAIPEYYDHIPGNIVGSANGSLQFGVILYMRARVGATGIAGVGLQYNPAHLTPYGFIPIPAYLTNPSLPTQPIGKDAFILISSGTDRIFGTADDIIHGN